MATTRFVCAHEKGTRRTHVQQNRGLETLGIITNRNAIPFDPAPANVGSGLRLGSPAMTTRGMMEKDFHHMGILIAHALRHHDSPSTLNEIRREVVELVSDYPLFAKKWLPKQVKNCTVG